MTEELNHIEAFIKAQLEMTAPKFNNTNPHFKNKFADLAAVDDACKTALLNNGLTHIQAYKLIELGGTIFWGIDTKIVHAKTLKEVGSGGFYPINQALNDQQKGSGTTYAKRYSLAMACNLVAEEDDDGNKASEATKPAAPEWKEPQKADREHPDVKGNVTKAKEMFKDWCLNLAACDDDSSLDAFIIGFQKMTERFKDVIPEWAEGDTGVDARITKRKQEISNGSS